MRKQRGQSTLEYAVVIAVIVAALLAIQVYMKGGVQGKLRDATDQVGEQYSPTAYHGKFQVVQKSATEETLHVGAQGKGESKSETTTIGNVTGISTKRVGQDVGGGNYEKLTDGQSNEGCLFPPCP